MPETMLKVLEYGVLGLCAITLVLVWRVLQAEQKREGDPRTGILQASYVFMIFSFALAVLNGYVQLKEGSESVQAAERMKVLETRLRTAEDKLLQIRSAAQPILNARGDILMELPPGPARNTLVILVNSLKETLQ